MSHLSGGDYMSFSAQLFKPTPTVAVEAAVTSLLEQNQKVVFCFLRLSLTL